MKNQIKHILLALALLALSTLNVQLSTAFAQGTAFMYQGQLVSNGNPASGTYNLTFTLFTVGSGGSAVAGPVATNGVIVSNGLFTVTIDFGASVWNGTTNWLEIAVETNLANSFTTLAPRQQITPVPYAIFAKTASNLSGTLPASQLSAGTASISISGNAATATGPRLMSSSMNTFLPGIFNASGQFELSPNDNIGASNNFFIAPFFIGDGSLEVNVNAQSATNAAPGGNIATTNIVANPLEVWIETNNSVWLPGFPNGHWTNWPASTTCGIQETLNQYPFNANLGLSSTPPLHLAQGFFNCTGQIVLTNNTVILGAGNLATVVKYTGAPVYSFITVAEAQNTVQNTNGVSLTMKDLQLVYAVTNVQARILTITNYASDIENVAFCGPWTAQTTGANQSPLLGRSQTPSGLIGLELDCAGPKTAVSGCYFDDLATGIHIPPGGNYGNMQQDQFAAIGATGTGGSTIFTNLYAANGPNAIFNWGACIAFEGSYGQFVCRDGYFQVCGCIAIVDSTISMRFEDGIQESGAYAYLAISNSTFSTFDYAPYFAYCVKVNPNVIVGYRTGFQNGPMQEYAGGALGANAPTGETAKNYQFANGGTFAIFDGGIDAESWNASSGQIWVDQNEIYSTANGFAGNGAGLTHLTLTIPTNVPSDFAPPPAGQFKLVSSNYDVWLVTPLKTNLVSLGH